MSNPIPAALRRQLAGSSFYAGMRVLPRAEREAMFAVYGFCRLVDDIADDLQGDRPARLAALDAWRADLAALYLGADPGQAGFLVEPVRRFALAHADFEAVIDGMAMDVAADLRWPTTDTLDLYCDRVASAVGRLSVRIFGMAAIPGEALAHHLGRALQLTNILRDLDEDAAIGRVYLPREAIAAAGIAMETPAQVVASPRIDTAARIVAATARAHYRSARAVLQARPAGHLLAPRLMEAVYARVLRQMERTGWGPPRRRARVARRVLLWTAIRLVLTR